MPPKRNYVAKRRRDGSPDSKRVTKPRYRKRYRKNDPLVSLVSMHRFGWPKQAKQTFSYGRRITIPVGNGSTQGIINIRANAPQDPELSLGGDNAYGWDQFMGTLYDRCYCYASKITVTFMPEPSAPYYGGIHTRQGTSTTITTPELYMNQPNEPFVTIGQYANPKSVTRVVNVRKWLPFAAKDDLASDSLSNPAAALDFQIWAVQGNPGSTTALNFTAVYTIEYYCILGRVEPVPPSI